MNTQLEGRTVSIRFSNDQTTNGQDVTFKSDSLFWISSKDQRLQSQSLSQIDEVYYDKVGRGFLVGVGVAMVAGLAIALSPADINRTIVPSMSYTEALKPIAIMSIGLTSMAWVR